MYVQGKTVPKGFGVTRRFRNPLSLLERFPVDKGETSVVRKPTHYSKFLESRD